MSQLPYRPEIDGLRAIAVVGVVLYHAGWLLPGGYVGVDVFFVISGYLLTGIILKQLEAGQFRLMDFWARRVRRILPAALVVSTTSLVAGCIFLTPDDLLELAHSAIANTLLVSNLYFWKVSTAYFEAPSIMHPLLHTWSLSIEEQFYIILPLALTVLHKLSRRKPTGIIALTLAFSLGLSLYATTHHSSAAFFYLPTRAWELLAGSLLACRPIRVSGTFAELLSTTGLIMILGAMLVFNDETPFPGVAALLPVGGTAAVIVGCASTQTCSGSILSTRPFVFTGLISYSLYLWHWPLFSFAAHILIERTAIITGALLAATFLIATVSWRFIEQPCRNGPALRTIHRALVFSGLGGALVILPALWINTTHGMPDRFDEERSAMITDLTPTSKREGFRVMIGSPRTQDAPDFVVWGDSHGTVIGDMLNRLGLEKGMSGDTYLVPGQVPVAGRLLNDDTENALLIDAIIQSNTRHLFLVARWSVYTERSTIREVIIHAADGKLELVDLGSGSRPIAGEQYSEHLRRKLHTMLDHLTKNGITVWIIKQGPEADRADTARQFYLSRTYPRYNSIPATIPVSDDQHTRWKVVDALFAGLDSDNVHIVDPTPGFLNEDGHLILHDSRALFMDEDHISAYAAETIMRPLFADIFTTIQSELASLEPAE